MEALITIGVIVAVIVGGMIVLYNGIIGNENAVARAWADVIAYERQKNKVLTQLERIAKEYTDYEASLQRQITELRTAIDKTNSQQPDPKQLGDIEQKTKALVGGLNIAVENYPDLKASELLRDQMGEIAKQQENITAAIAIFNRNVEIFNNGLEMFPSNLVNGLLCHKQQLDTFTDSEAQAEFEFKPKL